MSAGYHSTQDDLLRLQHNHPTFVGIDSDGCVFDTMDIKQKQCFHPEIIRLWHLEPIEKYLREAAEFVNLYSRSRGRNRFPCLMEAIDLLRDRPEVLAANVKLPEFVSLRKWIDSGAALGNPQLQQLVEETGDAELATVCAWSNAVNDRVEQTVKNIPPFRWVRESLEKINQHSDVICVSQTPGEALLREWDQNDITRYVALIAGQELGTKAEHIELATRGHYPAANILMIGDAPGDCKAAKANDALFFPINPAHEEASWERFYKEAYDKFLAGEYAGVYEQELIAEFESLLPETPPWKV